VTCGLQLDLADDLPIALDPYFVLSYGALGRSYSALGDSAAALTYWEKGAPKMAFEFLQWLAREHMILGNFDQAEEII
jgi:tetratricopeptide (TPR) repeat protein